LPPLEVRLLPAFLQAIHAALEVTELVEATFQAIGEDDEHLGKLDYGAFEIRYVAFHVLEAFDDSR
jgi:hypothetical protein